MICYNRIRVDGTVLNREAVCIREGGVWKSLIDDKTGFLVDWD
ncbi:uncharacterized protein METZ01_LOCUS248781 [marine metagenome]|uniref:Uncharacterized protein n=1 Tax=marine metagenome TaxID=408172 RepID=A0A382I9K4_9ZZZZ